MAGSYPLRLARSTGNGPVLPPFQQSRRQKQFSLARRILLPGEGRCKVGKRESAVYGRAEHAGADPGKAAREGCLDGRARGGMHPVAQPEEGEGDRLAPRRNQHRVELCAGERAILDEGAAGADLRELFVGSEGAFGVLTEVTVRIRPVPAATAYRAWTFPDFSEGASAIREATQRGIRPTVLRLSDETETRVNAAMGGHLTRMRGSLAVATAEGNTADEADAALAALDAVFRRHRATSRGEDPARSWERGRFASPALRDTLMDIGVLAETLETATTWSNLTALKAAVTAALAESLTSSGTKPIVLCHISHVYPAGASLYFTVVAALAEDPQAQWARAKDAASRAIGRAHGTISHHHAVGRDHRPYLETEIGSLGVEVLRAVKGVLDPRGIMNPGVLIAPAAETAEPA